MSIICYETVAVIGLSFRVAAFSPPANSPPAKSPPPAAILPPVDCNYILSHSLTLLFALLNMLSHCCCVVLAL